jgi:hypothetical protein
MKTRYLLFLAFLFICHPRTTLSSPTLALSGAGCSNVNPGAGSTVSCLVAPLNTLGRAQIVAIKWCDDSTCTTDTSGDTFTITDTALNSYGSCQRLDSASGTDRRGMAVCHAQNIAAHSSNSVLLSITSGNTVQLAGLIVSEVMGGTASVTVDQHGTTDLAATAPPLNVTTAGATVQGNELIYSWVNINSGTLSVGQPVNGGMGTNYPNRQLGTPAVTGGGTAAMDQWNNAAPRAGVKTETMSFNASGFTLNPTAQQRGIIVTYKSPVNDSPISLDFGNQATGASSAAQTITITNTSTANINFGSNPVRGGANAADFTVGAGTCVNGLNVGAGSSCSIILTFNPSAVGVRTATVSIFTSATGSPHVMSLSGTGISPSSLTGKVKIGTGIN